MTTAKMFAVIAVAVILTATTLTTPAHAFFVAGELQTVRVADKVYRCETIDGVREIGGVIELTTRSRPSVKMFGAEYRSICRMLGVETLEGVQLGWRAQRSVVPKTWRWEVIGILRQYMEGSDKVEVIILDK